MKGICEDLRKSVLQAAIQGRLTQQLPEDGDAKSLYAEIQKEKQRLIKEGKIKKEKPLPEITVDDIPFDIPENWKWVRLTDLGSFSGGNTPKSDELVSNGEIPYFKVSDMNRPENQKMLMNTDLYVRQSFKGKVFPPQSIVFPKNGGAVFTNKRRILGQESVVDLNTGCFIPYKSICFNYIWQIFNSLDFRKITKGTALPTLGYSELATILIPLPPLAEQKRIVARVDELMKRIDEMEKTEKNITALYDAFPGDMKAALLQAAIQGKLTEQLASDGDAETLYQDIQKEKQRLIKEGKIKKEKPLSEITDEDIPFDIPETWRWVRLAEFATLYNGRAYKQPELLSSGKWKILRVGNLFTNNEWYYSNFDLDENKYCDNGDLIYAWSASFGPYIWRGEKVIYHYHIWKIAHSEYVDKRFLYFLLLNDTIQIKEDAHGSTMQHTTKAGMEQRIFPLPPLAEQKRIVEKLDQLLPLCDSMKEAIDATA